MVALLERFTDCLEALVYHDRRRFYKTIGLMHAALDFEMAEPPEFREMLAAIEATKIPDSEMQSEYDATRISAIALDHAKRFHREYCEVEAIPSIDDIESAIRIAIEEAIGEPRQPSIPMR